MRCKALVELVHRQPLEEGGIAEYLGDDSAPRLRVLGELDLYHDRPPRILDGEQVRTARSARNFPAENDDPGRASERHEVRCPLDEVVELLLLLKGPRLEHAPARSVVSEDRRHEASCEIASRTKRTCVATSDGAPGA